MRSRAGRAVIPVDRLPNHGHETDATRIPGDEVNIPFPRTVLWRSTGSAEEAIDDVLALPVPVPDATHPPRRNGVLDAHRFPADEPGSPARRRLAGSQPDAACQSAKVRPEKGHAGVGPVRVRT